jgi:hypothetical protein
MFDGYLLSFLSTYLSINDIVRLTRSSVLFREPILLETLERRICSESSVRISDKQVIDYHIFRKMGYSSLTMKRLMFHVATLANQQTIIYVYAIPMRYKFVYRIRRFG